MAVGLTTIILAVAVPLAGEPSPVVWIVGFGSAAIWAGLMAEPRYRSVRGRGSIVSKAGVGLGAATIAIAIYAFVAIVLASSGTRIPAPSHWFSPDAAAAASVNSIPTFVSIDPPQTEAAEAPLTSPIESERLALGQSAGTAVYVLEQTAAPDGSWPASLAVTTDAATLMTPDGITLAPLPPGTQVVYSTSSDLHEFSLTLFGPLGAIASYESTTGTLSSTVP